MIHRSGRCERHSSSTLIGRGRTHPRWLGFSLVCFFFQAEDGIRDDLVTGVQTCALPITPNKRRFFGVGKHAYMCTVTTTPLTGTQTPRAVLAQVAAAPLIGPWFIVLMLILLALLVAIIFKPRVDYFGTDPQLTARDPAAIQIQAGQTVTLYWRTWAPLGHLQIQSSIHQDTEAGP